MRNSPIEMAADRKMKAHWLGPLVVIHRTQQDTYILAELDGSVWQNNVAKFRVIPYLARKRIPLPERIEELIDMSQRGLAVIEESPPSSLDEVSEE